MRTAQLGKKKYNSIDVAKFVCAILVVAIHVSPFGDTDSVLRYVNFGISKYIARIAVPFFFVAAGFFLFKKTDQNVFHIDPLKKYSLRILRLYIIWSIIYLPIDTYLNMKNRVGFFRSVLLYVRDFLLVGNHSHLWYLNALLFAVIAVGFLLYKRVKPNLIFLLGFFLYFVGLFGNSWFGLTVPLKTGAPALWNVLHFLNGILTTTRNGLFDGFVFVSMGMCFSYYGNKLAKSKALLGLLVSITLLGIEVFLLNYFKIEIRGNDMFLFLVPSAYFLFSYVEQINLKDNQVYKTLRVLSSLVFYTHLWVAFIFSKLVNVLNENLNKTCLKFICISAISLAISYIIYKLSLNDKYKFLQKLYN